MLILKKCVCVYDEQMKVLLSFVVIMKTASSFMMTVEPFTTTTTTPIRSLMIMDSSSPLLPTSSFRDVQCEDKFVLDVNTDIVSTLQLQKLYPDHFILGIHSDSQVIQKACRQIRHNHIHFCTMDFMTDDVDDLRFHIIQLNNVLSTSSSIAMQLRQTRKYLAPNGFLFMRETQRAPLSDLVSLHEQCLHMIGPCEYFYVLQNGVFYCSYRFTNTNAAIV